MNEIVPFISEVGFPIAVTLYLLYRIEAKLGCCRAINSKFAGAYKGISSILPSEWYLLVFCVWGSLNVSWN